MKYNIILANILFLFYATAAVAAGHLSYVEICHSGGYGRLLFEACATSTGFLYNGSAEICDNRILNRCVCYGIYANFGKGYEYIDHGSGAGNFNVYFCGSNKTRDNRYISFSLAELKRALTASRRDFQEICVFFRVPTLDASAMVIVHEGAVVSVDTCVVRIVRRDGRLFINGFQECLEKDDNGNAPFLEIQEIEF